MSKNERIKKEKINEYHNMVLKLYSKGLSIESIQQNVKVYSKEYINAIINNDYGNMIKEKDIDVYKTMRKQGYSLFEISERTGYSIGHLYDLEKSSIRRNRDFIKTMHEVIYLNFEYTLNNKSNINYLIRNKLGIDNTYIYRSIKRFNAAIGSITIKNLDKIVELYKNNIEIEDICKELNMSATSIRESILYYKLRLQQLLLKNQEVPALINIDDKYDKYRSYPSTLIRLEKDCEKNGIDVNSVLTEFTTIIPVYKNVDIIIKNPDNEHEYILYSNGKFTKHYDENYKPIEQVVEDCDRLAAEEEMNDILDNMDNEERIRIFDDIIAEADEREEEYDDITDIKQNKTDVSSLMIYGNEILKSLYLSSVISDEQNINLKLNVENKSIIIEPDNSVYDSITIKLK